MLPLATILHPTDFSEHSEFAFRLACALARDYKARLVLLHVMPPPMVIYAGGPGAGGDVAERRGSRRKNCSNWKVRPIAFASNRR